MKIRPIYPLILPLTLVTVIILIAHFLPSLTPIDDVIISLVNATPDEWFGAMQNITRIGDVIWLIVTALFVAGWELYRRHYVRALVMVGSLAALPAFYLIKQAIQRARPVTDYIAEHGIHGYSFPSGHATGTFAVYGMIAWLIYSHTKGYVRIVGISVCSLIILLVSFSRVYLGVHFPTDIFAGWLLALVVISLLRSASLFLAKRSNKSDKIIFEDTTESPEKLEQQR